jgi:hypothetical protein
MREEGIDYVPVDQKLSIDKWTIRPGRAPGLPGGAGGEGDAKPVLVGPLQNIRGIGPKSLKQILDHRRMGIPLMQALEKRLSKAETKLDTLYPIRDAFSRVLPDPAARNIHSTPRQIGKLKPAAQGQEVLVFCTLAKMAPRDENELIIVAKRGYEIKDGKTKFVNMFVQDDTGQCYAKINRFKFEALAPDIINRGRVGKAMYAIKGRIPPWRNADDSFVMIMVDAVRYIGDIEPEPAQMLDERDAPRPKRVGKGGKKSFKSKEKADLEELRKEDATEPETGSGEEAVLTDNDADDNAASAAITGEAA